MVCNPKAKGLIIRCFAGACGNSTASRAQGEVAEGTDMPVLPLVPLVMLLIQCILRCFGVALGPESAALFIWCFPRPEAI